MESNPELSPWSLTKSENVLVYKSLINSGLSLSLKTITFLFAESLQSLVSPADVRILKRLLCTLIVLINRLTSSSFDNLLLVLRNSHSSSLYVTFLNVLTRKFFQVFGAIHPITGFNEFSPANDFKSILKFGFFVIINLIVACRYLELTFVKF